MFTFVHKKSIIKTGNNKFQDIINAPRIIPVLLFFLSVVNKWNKRFNQSPALETKVGNN